MKNTYPERRFLHLIDSNEVEEMQLVKDILKSPLGLASIIITKLFEDRLTELKDDLDEIKQFAAGIGRAEKLSTDYTLASYYPFMFAFQQYFHSSFRARQGKVLEKMLQSILKKYGKCDSVPDSNKDKLSILSKIFDESELPNLDIDVMAVNLTSKKTLIIQLRSRDDTGGTTAKGSLVDFLRELLRLKIVPQGDVLYLVCVWDPRKEQQKLSTVKKMFSALKDLVDISEKDFHAIVEDKVKLQEKISLKVAYGTDEIAASLFEWIDNPDDEVLESISIVVDLVSDWDDLWISYSIASLELEIAAFSGVSNVKLLNEKYDKIEICFDFESYQALTDSIERIIEKIIPLWTEDSIPLKSLSDKAQYIRDLLFLKAYYEKSQFGTTDLFS
jgi:hypothetical protein